MTYEHDTINNPTVADLDKASADGWEIVSVAWFHTGNLQTALLRREKKTEKPNNQQLFDEAMARVKEGKSL